VTQVELDGTEPRSEVLKAAVSVLAENLYKVFDSDSVLQGALDVMLDYSAGSVVALYRLDDQTRSFHPVYVAGLPASMKKLGGSVPYDRSLQGACVEQRAPIFSEDFMHDERGDATLRKALGDFGIRSALCVPLLHADRCVGSLSLGFKDVPRIPDGDMATLEAICRFIALAMVSNERAKKLDVEVHRRKAAEQALRRSEIKFRTIFESAADAIFTMKESLFVDANPRSADMFGTTVEQLVGSRPYQFSPERQPDGRLSRDKALEKIRAAFTIPQRFEWTHSRLDGSPFDTEVSLNRVDLDEGPLLLAVVRDISARNRSRKALRLANHRLRILSEILKAILDARSPRHVAEAALNRLGELLPISRASVMVTEDDSSDLVTLAAVGITGPGLGVGARVRIPDEILETFRKGEHRFVENTADLGEGMVKIGQDLDAAGIARGLGIPLVADGHLIGGLTFGFTAEDSFTNEHVEIGREVAAQLAVGLHESRLRQEVEQHAEALENRVRDRTAELRVRVEQVERLNRDMETLLDDLLSANRRLEKTTRRLHKANEELETFAYSVSHDLRAPLRGMHGFAEALIQDYEALLPERGKNYLGRIVQASRRMDDMISALLTYSQVSKVSSDLRTVSLESVVSEALRSLDAMVCDRDAKITIRRPLHSVFGQPALIVQIVENLLSNAMKFVPDDRSPDVMVWSERDGHFVRLWVEDNGIGIAEPDSQRIFEVFERLHTEEEYPGTGIGLAIVKKGVERLGGQVEVYSQPGKGARFLVSLPSVE